MLSIEEQVPCIIDLKNGDKKAFDAFYHQYHQPVYCNIAKFIYQYDIAEDILQEVFLALWEHRSELDPDRSIAGWLFVVSYNKSISWLKRNSKEKRFATVPVTDAYEVEEINVQEQIFEDQVALMNNAVDQLPLRKKQAFRLCKLEGRSYEEAGELLGITTDTVKEYVKTSSQMIRRYIATQPVSEALLLINALLLLPV